MADENVTLSDDERAELEKLRAEKAAREQAQAAAAQKAELERLRAEKAQAEEDAAAEARDAAARERAREYMEPDEDLKMPLAQKIVLLAVALLIVWFVFQLIGGGLISN
jgi:Flp pilus assembly protein TadB